MLTTRQLLAGVAAGGAAAAVALSVAAPAQADPYYPPPSVLCGLKADGLSLDEMVNMYTPPGYSADARAAEIMAVVNQYCPP